MKLFYMLIILALSTPLSGQLEFYGQELFGGTETRLLSSGTKASDGTIALAGIKEQDAWIVYNGAHLTPRLAQADPLEMAQADPSSVSSGFQR